MKNIILVLVTITVITVTGCGSKGPDSSVYIREGVDLNYIEKVAILPFDNVTSDQNAGKRIQDMTFTEVLSLGKFDVVEQGVVGASLREMAIRSGSAIDAPVLKILSKRLGVNAFISGTVNNLKGGSSGYNYPEVSLTLYLIDAETAEVLWRTTAYKNGYSIWNRLFDLDPQDQFEITLLLLQDMLASLGQ